MGNTSSKFTTHTTGPTNQKPVAVLANTKIDTLITSIIQLDGRQSFDPEGQPITYSWSFIQVPIGSTVESSGFRPIRPNSSAVSFIPDITGIYVVQLVVNDGELDSDPVTARINIQLSRVPCGENIVPDAHFLWSYISDFWELVEDREKITSIWSSTIQVLGTELIKLWGTDNNKSLDTIQNTFQRRWQEFSARTNLLGETDQRIIVGKNDSGTGGRTGNIGQTPGVGNTSVFFMPLGNPGDVTETDFTNLQGNYGANGRVISINGDLFTIDRVSNEDLPLGTEEDGVTTAATNLLSSATLDFVAAGVQPSDVVRILEGADANTYRVVSVNSPTELALEYVDSSVPSFTGSVSASFEVVRPFSIVVVDQQELAEGQIGASWRIPNLLHVPGLNFENAGVRAGDIVVFEVMRRDTNISAEIQAQVIGVDRERIGFEFSLQDLSPTGGQDVELDLFTQLVRDLRLVPPDSSESRFFGAAQALLSYMPTSINLFSRPFTTFRLTFKAKEIIHNSIIPGDELLVSAPALQEQLIDPPVVLRENLDYIIGDTGNIELVGTLFNLQEPSPPAFWAECAIFDNGGVIEENFGRLVNLLRDNLSERETRAPYLSAVRGLFFAFTNGPTVANVRLGLQILLGLPFSEERGLILDIDESFGTDSAGSPLGRVLVEDVDDDDNRLGFRRTYLYPVVVGLEDNPITGQPYQVGEIIERFVPVSKGVEVQDYIKDPLWWQRALLGLEILKFFTFKVSIDSEVFDSNDVEFAFDFVRTIKPAYTRVISTAVINLVDDIEVEDEVAGKIVLKFYDNNWGLEATARTNDRNQQGGILFNLGSRSFETRSLSMLRDVVTFESGGRVRASSVTGWSTDDIRGRQAGPPVVEGDILVIHPGQQGAGLFTPGYYEIDTVIDGNTVELLQEAFATDPTTYDPGSLDTGLFDYGTELECTILRRETNPVVMGSDLSLSNANNIVTSAAALFLTNSVSPGDHMVVESGSNIGEYFIEALTPVSFGPPFVPPLISETQVRLVNLDGSVPSFTTESNQDFRVVNPLTQARTFAGAQSLYNGGSARMELAVEDPVTGDPLDFFTPGMVGLYIGVANSDETVNDGTFLIMGYLNSGRVVLNSASTTSDAVAQSNISLE